MAIKYSVDEERNFIYVKAESPLSAKDMIGYEAEFIDDERVRPGFTALFDASKVRVVDVTPEVVDVLVNMERSHPERFKGSKRALLFTENMGWDAASYFAKEADGSNLVFFSLDVALVWLGMKAKDLPEL